LCSAKCRLARWRIVVLALPEIGRPEKCCGDVHELLIRLPQIEVLFWTIRCGDEGELTLGMASDLIMPADRFEPDLAGTFDDLSQLAQIGIWEYAARWDEARWSRSMFALCEAQDDTNPSMDDMHALFPDGQFAALIDEADRCGTASIEVQMSTIGGNRKWVHAVARSERDAGRVSRRYGLVRDITVERIALQEVTRLAERDALTDLRNRASMLARLTDIQDRGNAVALLMLDLDGFKDINDGSGHAAGDHCLIEFSDRLKSLRARGRMICRLGGDEFGIILESAEDVSAAEALAKEVRRLAQLPIDWRGRTFQLSASIGIATRPASCRFEAEQLIREADLALYAVKARGRNGWQKFTFEMKAEADNRLALLHAARGGLANSEMELHFQPMVDLQSGETIGREGVLRWRRTDGRYLAPHQFRPVFEDIELAQSIGALVLDQGLRALAKWKKQAWPGFLSLNVGPHQFRTGDWVGQLLTSLELEGLKPADLRIEVTEDVLLSKHSGDAASACASLEKAGVRVAFDDFGTGYASLTHLQEFPVSIVKIDRSFIRPLGRSAASPAIVQAICQLATALDKTVIATGVETAAQVSFLRSVGCQMGQGDFFAAAGSDRNGLALPSGGKG
jgi:diguanylate cyclase (GGDEF)-like protein